MAAVSAPRAVRCSALGGEAAAAPRDRLDIACIGIGGQMHSLARQGAAVRQSIITAYDVDSPAIEPRRKAVGVLARPLLFLSPGSSHLDHLNHLAPP